MIIYCFSNHGSTHFSEMQKQRLLNIDLIADATSADATSSDATGDHCLGHVWYT